MEEIWRDIEGYEGLYQVSNFGRVRNGKKEILKNSLKNGGYNYVSLRKNKISKQQYVHRIVAKAFILNVKPKHFIVVNHIDCNKSNNSVENLEWCTQKHNIAESIKNNLQKRHLNTIVKDTETNNIFKFRSMREASFFIGKKYNFISFLKDSRKTNCIEYKNYLIEILEFGVEHVA